MFTNLLILILYLNREESGLQLACQFLVYKHDIELIYGNLLEIKFKKKEISAAFCFQTNPPTICKSIQNKILILRQHLLKHPCKVETDLRI